LKFQVLISPALPLPAILTAIFSSPKTEPTASVPATRLGSPLSADPPEPVGKASTSFYPDPRVMRVLERNFKMTGKFSFFSSGAVP